MPGPLQSRLVAFRPVVLSALRLVSALCFLEHGTSKLFGFPDGSHTVPTVLSLIGVAGLLEVTGGVLLAAGLFTRLAAFILSGEMAFAYFMAHFPHSIFPLLNGGDAAVLYCFVFLYLVFAGGGCISVDAVLARRKL